MNIYDFAEQQLNEASKVLSEFNIDAGWHACRDCVPSDERPVFVAHKDSFNSPGRIAHYSQANGWYRYLEGKTIKKMSSPKRWHEALVPETYRAFTEALKAQLECAEAEKAKAEKETSTTPEEK